MRQILVITITAILLLTVFITVTPDNNVGATTVVVGTDGDYATIQDAVDEAAKPLSTIDTIFVKANAYNEEVTIEGFSGLSIIAEGANEFNKKVILDGPGFAGFTIKSSTDITIEGFKIMNYAVGIYLIDSNSNNVKSNNIVQNTNYGMIIERSSFNVIHHNTIRENYYGILLNPYSESNTVHHNKIAKYSQGILVKSNNNNIHHNKLDGVVATDAGIGLAGSIGNEVHQNVITLGEIKEVPEEVNSIHHNAIYNFEDYFT